MPDICQLCDSKATIFDKDGGLCSTHWEEAWATKVAAEKAATKEAGGPWPQTCPRRAETLSSSTGEDTWDLREQFHKGLQARHCSWCGSLHPDDFMEMVKSGTPIGSTDKTYKVYVGDPMATKFYFPHLSIEQRKEFVDLHNDQKLVFDRGGKFYVLPFFMGYEDGKP